MRKTRTTVTTAVVAFLVAVLAGCAGGTQDAQNPSTATPTTSVATSASQSYSQEILDAMHGDSPDYVDPKSSASSVLGSSIVSSDNPCPLPAADVQQALQSWIAPGAVTVDPRSGQYDTGWYRCFYNLPDGSFGLAGSGGVKVVLTEGVELVVDTYPYALNYIGTTGVYDTATTWGGDTASEVHSSALASELALAAADNSHHTPQDHPEIGAGLVTDGSSGFVLAGVGSNWYRVSIGNVSGNAAYTDAFVELAKVLAAKG